MRAAGRGEQRGAPADGPAQGLSKHQLFVKVPSGENDPKCAKIALETLRYISGISATVRKMGVFIQVVEVRNDTLRDPRLKAALTAKGVSRLPALVTRQNVYLGLLSIKDLYDNNIREYQAFSRKGENGPQGSVDEEDDPLTKLYGEEMTIERAKADDEEEEPVGSDGGADYQKKVEQWFSASKRSGGRPPHREEEDAPSVREDNIAHTRAAPRGEGRGERHERSQRERDEDEIQETLARLGGGRGDSEELRRGAFSGGGGGEEDEGENDTKDDFMERSYWAAQASSDALHGS
jgi:hypothetical protein